MNALLAKESLFSRFRYYLNHSKKLMRQKPIAIISLALLTLGPALQAEEKFPLDSSPVTDNGSEPIASYAEILEPAQESVVSVTTASIVETMRDGASNPMEEFLRRFYGLPPSQAPGRGEGEPQERRIPNGLGSGVIISEDGYILTNNHVVVGRTGEPADEITVHLSDGVEVDGELVGRDERTDVALIKIEKEGLPYLKMADSENLKVGDVVFAVGNPLGVGQTSTMGIVSATGRSNLGLLGNEGYENFIQTDAAINRGNSGGALVDAKGRLVGINTAIFSQTGGNIGIGFAIPSRMARTVVLELIENGEVRRGYLGVSIRDLDQELSEAFGLDTTDGALVEQVQDGTPAAKAGIQRGDVIVSVNDNVVESVSSLRLRIASLRPGSDVEIEIMREGENKSFEIKLGSLDDPDVAVGTDRSPLNGVGIEPLSDDTKEKWKIDLDSGLVITEVDARSPHANTLAPGMVILEVNDKEVNTIGELDKALMRGRVNKFWVSFRGNRGFIALRVD